MKSTPTKLSLEQLNNHYILFRHGQSKANVAKIVVSRPENGIPSKGVGPPSPSSNSSEGKGWGLTEFGKEQVKNVSYSGNNELFFSHSNSETISPKMVLLKKKCFVIA